MSSSRSFDLAIVGRGAVGAAAALGLAQAGLKVCLIGPHAPAAPASDPWDTRVFALSPATRELLQTLRVWDALPAERMAPVYDMRVYPSASAVAPELHLGAYAGQVECLAWIVENRALMGVLDNALRFAGVDTLDDTVSDMQLTGSGPSGRIELALQSGRSVVARLAIAADGADSALRTLAGIEPSVREYGQRGVVANFETRLPHADTAYQWFGDEIGVLALLPLPADEPTMGRTSMVWSAPEALADELLNLSPEALAERVRLTTRNVLGEMAPISAAQAFPLRLVRAPRLIAPRVVLVGDAAHVIHPLAGQGMNLGFGDVACLLSVLKGKEFFRDLGDTLLWRRYERARREAVSTMQTATDGLARLFGPVPAPVAAIRDLGWRAVARSGWIRRRLVAHAVR
jgi:ubiquinone biosynthesis UbiH/UbiF/VisC/COQ6 family hydroxylase